MPCSRHGCKNQQSMFRHGRLVCQQCINEFMQGRDLDEIVLYQDLKKEFETFLRTPTQSNLEIRVGDFLKI